MVKPLAYDLSEVLKLFQQRNVFDLRGLSNRLIKEAALENNYAKAELGVIAYALHKMESKPHFVQSDNWPRLKQAVCDDLENCFLAAKQDNRVEFISCLKKVVSHIESIDNELGNFAQSVYDKAKVKQASLAYSYGLSIPQSAELTGADKKDVQSYIGFTTMPDEDPSDKTISGRVQELRELLSKDIGA